MAWGQQFDVIIYRGQIFKGGGGVKEERKGLKEGAIDRLEESTRDGGD